MGAVRFNALSSWCLILVLLNSIASHAAPPTLTGLYPAGGQRGTTANIVAIGSFDTWPISVWTSSPHLKVTPGTEKGRLAITIAAETPPGIYFLRGYDANGASGLRPFIVGSLPEQGEVEPNDQLLQAERISKPTVINGKLNRNGDVDCFAVELKSGQTLVASVESHNTLRSAGDMAMQLVLPHGTVLEQNHDYHGLDPQIAYTATQAGTVIVRLFSFPANPDSSIRFSGGELYIYRLTLTTAGFIDSVRPLAVQQGVKQPLRLLGWNLNTTTSQGILQSDGTVSHPQVAGVALLRLEPHPTFDSTLVNSGDIRPYTAPASITAHLTDKQAYRASFTMSKGKKLLIQVLSESLGLELDPVLTVVGAQGKVLHQLQLNELHSDLTTSFTPPADGVYHITVQDIHRRHGPRQAFLLRVVPEAPDYSLSVASDRYTLVPGKALEIPIKLVTTGGHSGKVDIRPTGLPASVKVENAISADKKTVTLKLQSEAPFNGPFQIVGESTETPGVKRRATATAAELALPTEYLWMTTQQAPAPKSNTKK